MKKMKDHQCFTTYEGRRRRQELNTGVSFGLPEFILCCLCVSEGVTRYSINQIVTAFFYLALYKASGE